jgi:multidrug efflux system membrane fusion protein
VAIHHYREAVARREQDARNRPIPIVAAAASVRNVPVYISALGTVTPTYSVTVRTQINGQLLRVLFREGQMVKTGELLAEIDPRPYLAQQTEFEGQLARDQALLANAKIDLKRYKKLYPLGSVSQQTYDTQIALVKQLEGTVKLDEGQLQAVKVNLIYCRITSPINGRVGLRLVDPGNFVQTTDTNGLIVINTINPITVIFPIPEDNVPEVIESMNKGKPLLTQAYNRTQNKLLAVGTLLTIDNQIDTTTGTVKLRAQFQNDKYMLFPDQFVNIQLLVNTLPHATIIPAAAVQHGAQGTFVYMLNQNHTVSVKPVKVSVVSGDYITVVKGVLPGQFVVVEGAEKLTEGARVNVRIIEK